MSTAKTKILYIVLFLITLVVTYFILTLVFKRESEPKPIFLKVVGFWDPVVFNTIKKDFQEKNPEITIEYEQRQKENYFPTLKADLVNKDTTPDLFWWHSGWGPELGKSLASLPESVMSAIEYEKTFYPITKTDMKLGSSYRGFPLEIDGLALLYNKSIFASSNFKEAPTTWAQLRQVYGPALTIRDKQRILNSAIALGTVNNVENFSEIIGLFLLQNGVAFVNNGKLNILDNKGSRGTNLVSDAVDGYLKFSKEDKIWDNTLPNSIAAFSTGKTAMIILPAEKIHTLLETLKKENLKLDFGVAPTPQLPDSETVTWGSYWAIGVSEKSNQKQASWKLAAYLTSKEVLREVFKYESEQNIFGRAFPRVDMAKEQTTNPYLAAYLVQAPSARSWYLHSDTYDQGLNDNIVTEFKNVVLEVETGGSASGQLKDLDKKLTAVLKKYSLISSVTAN